LGDVHGVWRHIIGRLTKLAISIDGAVP
jgi:hypothetical protein